MRGEKQIPSQDVWSLHVLPRLRGFLQVLSFLPHPKDVHAGLPGVSTLSQCEWVYVSASCDRRASSPGWVPALYPALLGEALAVCDSELE